MRAVYVPGVALLRRMFNAFSAFSVTNQYLLYHKSAAPETLRGSDDTAGVALNGKNSKPWRWPPFFMLSKPRHINTSRQNFESPNPQPYQSSESREDTEPSGVIQRLMRHPTLYEPLRRPRYPIVLCHGLYGFDVIGPESIPSLRMHYWSTLLTILRDKLGADVIVCSVPGTGSIAARAHEMHRQLKTKACGRGVNFFAHSMGGLDCRHLITHIRPHEYTPLSLTSIATPHRGSPFMDWCAENIGIGKLTQREELLSRSREDERDDEDHYHDAIISASGRNSGDTRPNQDSKKLDELLSTSTSNFSLSSLPSSFTTLLLSIVDSPAYANLTSHYLQNVFNPTTPDDPKVKYFSVAGRMSPVNVWHPFWLPKMVLDGVEEKERIALKKQAEEWPLSTQIPLWAREEEWGNDGLVPVQSAKWGEFLGIIEGADHWEIRGARGIQPRIDSLPLLGNGGHGADGWGFSLRDWSRFVGAWKDEKVEAAAATSVVTEKTSTASLSNSVIKSSTDTLSSVFDWLVDHVPGTGVGQTGTDTSLSEMKQHMDRVGNTKHRRKNELERLEDLERFYLALARKIYDEGL